MYNEYEYSRLLLFGQTRIRVRPSLGSVTNLSIGPGIGHFDVEGLIFNVILVHWRGHFISELCDCSTVLKGSACIVSASNSVSIYFFTSCLTP